MARRTPILFALTSHGLGHLTRSLAVARALRDAHPGVEIVVGTTVPAARVELDLGPPFVHRPVDYEPGTLQRSCFELDLEGTRAAYARFRAERKSRLEAETRFLRESGCVGVVSDVPALPVRAAAALGLPAVGVANFTWDWILEPLLAGTPLADLPAQLAEDYGCGLVQLALPFGPERSPFPRREPAPLVSRRARLSPAALRERLSLPGDDGRALVVVCPGGWEADSWDEIRVEGCAGYRFVTVGDLPVRAESPLHALPHALAPGVSFPDLVAAAEVVLAKPGYGIASECANHRTALVCVERPGFRETPTLLEGFRRLGPCAEISLADFFAGRWQPALDAVRGDPTPWAEIPADGAERVAGRLAELLGIAPVGSRNGPTGR